MIKITPNPIKGARWNLKLLILSTAILFYSCGPTKEKPISAKDPKEVIHYLETGIFEYLDQQNNMKSMLKFSPSQVRLSVFLDGQYLSGQDYSFQVGKTEGTNRVIDIFGNEGSWILLSNGNLQMTNKGEVFNYIRK